MNSTTRQTRGISPVAGVWSADALSRIRLDEGNVAAEIAPHSARPMTPDMDVWDAWPLSDPSGVPVAWRGGELWFALAVPRAEDPEQRHHLARIHHFHRKDDLFQHIAQTLPDTHSPAAREWSGSARYENGTVTLFFTATGNKGDAAPSYRQRLFQTKAEMPQDGLFGDWSAPTEMFQADERIYRAADENVGEPGKIKAFRDPAHYRSAEGENYILFTGSSAANPSAYDGLIGAAMQMEDDRYSLCPPLIDATGVCNELERPHIVNHDDRLYLFWSTQRGVFSPGVIAPTGLYGATAETVDGPWTLLNGHGLVIANPAERPTQAYSWWVLPDLSVASFVDYWGSENPDQPEEVSRRARFGGTFAPFVHITLDGATSRITRAG